jgi:hypothetical protein
MAISQAMCTSFKVGLLTGSFNFGTGTAQVYKIALYTSAATLGASTTAYTATNEVASGSGYTTGGKVLTVSTVPTSTGTTAFLDFSNVTWSVASFTARGALIYLADGVTNPAVAVLDFGADKTASSGDFVVVMPTADATNALIRIG